MRHIMYSKKTSQIVKAKAPLAEFQLQIQDPELLATV